ncbi:MAG: lycopene cyclase domain-containing protein [bacterium]|nr:lycopene cyclase domain-containing protein [bacterium]
MSYHYAYLLGIDLLMFLPAFLVFFLWRKDLRKEMLIAGSVFGVVAFLSEPIFILHYWTPEYLFPLSYKGLALGSLEDFLYGFLKGGVSAVIFEVLFREKFSRKKVRTHHWKQMIVPIYALGTALFIIPTVLFSWNPIYTSALAVVVFLVPLALYRRDLLPEAFTSGVLMMLLTFIGYKLVFIFFPDIIPLWWKLSNLSGVMLSGIPAEEMLESFVVGFFGGPFYEFFNGLRLKRYTDMKR